ncbi:MAG: low molecular weight protein-tyrosine-phosphatase [Rhodothermales bacterium]|nr:low molecular weight protein-tyrosine-phosphatase [Rhodothermales bacterium]
MSEPTPRDPNRPIRVLFVCMGNICRSPLAEGVFRQMVEEEGLAHRFEIDSAGTGGWHVGEAPDPRMRSTARRRGLNIDKQRARQVVRTDLQRFDHVFVMDKTNLHDTLALDPRGDHDTRVRLFREFDPEPEHYQVPDPYTGGQQGFEHVFDIVERTSRAILDRFKEVYGLDETREDAV